MSIRKKVAIWTALFLLLLISLLISLSFGAATIPFSDVKAFIFNQYQNDNTLLLYEIRLPRIIASALVGASLGVAGCYMQGMTRNPIASPSLFGVVSGASAVLSIAIVFFKDINYYGVLFACLIGSVLAGFIVFALSHSSTHKMSPTKVVLAGTAVSTLLYAISDFFSIRFTTAKQMTMWASGGLLGVSFNEIMIVLPIIVIGLIASLYYSSKLTLVSLDDEIALTLGESTKTLRIIFFLIVTFLTGASIALAGNISFVGLVIPHLVRKIVGGDYKYIVPISIISGTMLLVMTDTMARLINAPYETPITAIMAIVSYPIFLVIIKKKGGLR